MVFILLDFGALKLPLPPVVASWTDGFRGELRPAPHLLIVTRRQMGFFR